MPSETTITAIRLDSVDVSWRTAWDFVTVETSDGYTGVGEWSDAGSHILGYPVAKSLSQEFVGMSLDQALAVVQDRVLSLPPLPSADRRVRATVLGGLDSALCDVAARKAGIPLATWLGADDAAAVPLYANINRVIRERTPEEFARQARAAVDAGFSVVKCAPFDLLVGTRRARHGLELARAVREEVGDGVELLLDLHGHLQVAEIAATADQLIELHPGWIEDGARIDDLEGLRRVRDTTGIPIAAGEFVACEREIAPALEAGLIDVFMPDVKHAGGPRQALALGRQAAAAGVTVSPHNPCGPVATAHSAAASVAMSATSLEFAFGEWAGRPDLLEPAEPVVGSSYLPSARPGLGFEFIVRQPIRTGG